jgi:hypothetical protein
VQFFGRRHHALTRDPRNRSDQLVEYRAELAVGIARVVVAAVHEL